MRNEFIYIINETYCDISKILFDDIHLEYQINNTTYIPRGPPEKNPLYLNYRI